MKTKLAIALFGAVLAAGASLAANASDRGDGGWDDRGRGHGGWGYGSRDGWGHENRYGGHHHYWHPAPRWHHPGPVYRSYGGYPPPYTRYHDGVTIILRGRL